MEFNLYIFQLLIVVFLVFSSNTHAASTSNGKLLKFYPITKQQYRDILELTKQQSAISETDVMETHRSLADWSNTLQSSWNALFNAGDSFNKTLGQKGNRSYPICVIKTQDHVRRKRGARQHYYNNGYAGLAPNGVYPGLSYYGRSPYRGQSLYGQPYYSSQYYPIPYEEENIDEEVTNDGEDPEDNETVPEEIPDVDENENNNVPETDSNTPIINCVVVIRRKNQIINKPINPDTENTDDTNDNEYSPPSYEHPQYPHYPYPYPPQQPPAYPYPQHGHYPHPHPYPPYPHPYPYEKSHSSSRSNKHRGMDPGTMVQYQQMIAEYYRYLHSLYMADASTGMGKSDKHPDYVDDDLEEYDDKDIGEQNA